MIRFRFLGDPLGVYADSFKIGRTYDGDLKVGCWRKVSELANNNPEDWQEVSDKHKPLHKDTDLGYFAGLFAANGCEVSVAIWRARELIKQLDKEVGGES